MSGGRVGAALAGAAILCSACHRAGPATTPFPSPPGAPPEVQAPVGAAPIGGVATPAAVNSPDPQTRRFDVVAVEDTTFTILIGADRWVRRGTVGVTVDPRRRDALVAKFRVLSRAGDSVTALITGQTTRVSLTDVALMREPVPGPLRRPVFWGGLFVGAALGAAATLLVRH